ncbi:UNVERIFIED_CONTAM: Disease resistance RPP8-like protein 3 [Sesamum calycinum]|uniref:Disease resistance RPP8-like protein 3 n=1 Tax=Sesamum calycinum TaxID=2727403 RepID=A0AAW2K1J7_9LAMI
MHCFLKDASKRQDTDNSETIRNWVRELRDLATQLRLYWKDDTDWSRKTFGHGVEQYFVGMKKERQLLESLLTNDDHSSNQVISVCGMGGLGKTSLARKLYDAQKEKKCLVILDDIWKAEDWNKLRHAFPIGESGSRILLTTRNQNIASTGYVHRLEGLSEDEGWELLQKIALPNNYSQGKEEGFVEVIDRQMGRADESSICKTSSEQITAYEVQLYQNVIILNLLGTRIEEDPMEILEKLPVLRNLVARDAYVGREMVCRATGFPQLRRLVLVKLPNLVEWRVEKRSNAQSFYLSIATCSKLEMIPEGLKFITTLNQLYIYDMPKEFRKRVGVVDGEEGEDYHKIKHIPFIHIHQD